MRTLTRYNSKGLLSAIVGIVLLASCTNTSTVVQDAPSPSFGGVPYAIDYSCINDLPPFFVRNPSIEDIYISQSNAPLPFFATVPQFDASSYTVNSAAVPAFSIFAGRTRGGGYSIATAMHYADECKKFTAISIRTDQPDAFEVLPVNDWYASAGMDAVQALARLEDECEGMSALDAQRTFGDRGVRVPGRGIAYASDGFMGCNASTIGLAYGLRISGPDGDVVISNVFGEIFVRE